MWKKNGLIFISKVKTCSNPMILEIMYHYLQIILLNTKSDEILKYLENEFKINNNYLYEENINLRYYNQFLIFLLTFITNPIISNENKEIKLEKDIIHYLLEKPRTIQELIEKCIILIII